MLRRIGTLQNLNFVKSWFPKSRFLESWFGKSTFFQIMVLSNPDFRQTGFPESGFPESWFGKIRVSSNQGFSEQLFSKTWFWPILISQKPGFRQAGFPESGFPESWFRKIRVSSNHVFPNHVFTKTRGTCGALRAEQAVLPMQNGLLLVFLACAKKTGAIFPHINAYGNLAFSRAPTHDELASQFVQDSGRAGIHCHSGKKTV